MGNLVERNIKFWFIQTQKIIVSVLGFAVGYTIFFNGILHQNMNFMLILTMIFPLIIPMSYLTYYIPMILSFGCMRKEAVYGTQIMIILLSAEMFIVNIIHNELFGKMFDYYSQSYIYILIGMIWIGSLGQTFGAVSLKYGSKALWIGSVVFCVATIGISIGAGLVLSNDGNLEGLIELFAKYSIKGILIAGGVIFYIMSVVIFRNIIKKYEVRYV